MIRSVLFALVVANLVVFPFSAWCADPPVERAGTDVVLAAGQRAEELVSLNGDIEIEPGAQAKKATAIMGSVRLAPGAVVEEEAVAIGGDVRVGPGARVGGDAVSIGGKLTVEPGGRVEGQQTSLHFPFPHGKWPHHSWFRRPHLPPSPFWALGQVIAQFATLFALGLLLLLLFPARLEAVAASLGRVPTKDLLVGLLGTAAIPVLAVLLVVTLVGILLVPLEFVAVAAAGLFGFAALALAIARKLPIKIARGTPVVQLAIGTAIVVVLTRLPLVGGLFFAVGWFLAFGAVLRTRFGKTESANGGGGVTGVETPGAQS